MRTALSSILATLCGVGLSVAALAADDQVAVAGANLNPSQAAVTAAPTPASASDIHVNVLGEVAAPGRYAADGGSSVSKLLTLAGGVTNWAAATVYIVRADDSGQVKRYSIDRNDPRRADAPNRLMDRDTIMVSRTEQVFVTGEVHRPGVVPLTDGMTVREAVALAGDFTAFGTYRHVSIQRGGPDGVKTIKAEPDDLLEPGDILRATDNMF